MGGVVVTLIGVIVLAGSALAASSVDSPASHAPIGSVAPAVNPASDLSPSGAK